MKRFIPIMIGLVILVLILNPPAFAADETGDSFVYGLSDEREMAEALKKEMEKHHSNEFYITQMESIKLYNILLHNMEEQTKVYSSRVDCQYPDYYGGAYIDNQSGELVVLVTDLSEITLSRMTMFAQGSDLVRFELCNTSYNGILTAIKTLSENLEYFESQGVNIDCIRDDILGGHVVVDVQELDSSKIASIKAVANYDFLCFQNSEGMTLDTSVKAGSGIYNKETNMASTLGFAATLDGMSGVVVAGHTAETVGDTFATDDAEETTIGDVVATAWRNRSTADAAFVEAARGITPSNGLASSYGNIWDVLTYECPVNTSVCMAGAYSISHNYGMAYGEIKGFNLTAAHGIGEPKIYDQWYATYKAYEGDSGAPVMIYEGNYDVPRYRLVGIHSGRNKASTLPYISPYQNIVDELGITFG